MIWYALGVAVSVLNIIIVDILIVCRFFRYESVKRIGIEIFTHLLCSLIYVFAICLFRGAQDEMPHWALAVCKLFPNWLFFVVSLGVFAILTIEGHREYRILINRINRSSIYEAINNVECALAFVLADGTIIIANRKMNWLVNEITGEKVWNYKDFWEYIIGFHGDERVIRVDNAIEPTFKLSDNSVWEFKMRIIEKSENAVIEILANDLTDLYAAMAEAKAENQKLEKIQKELAVTLRNIAEIRQQEELLAYKMRIHDKLGNAILTSANLIKDEELSLENRKEAAYIWKETVESLKKNAYQGEVVGEGSLEDVINTAKALGAKLILQGSFPIDNELFAPALREAMYNAVKHAKATEILVRGESTSEGMKVHIKDNGSCKAKKIKETGGLATMRRKLERNGGKMCVTINEGLELDLFFPTREDKTLH